MEFNWAQCKWAHCRLGEVEMFRAVFVIPRVGSIRPAEGESLYIA